MHIAHATVKQLCRSRRIRLSDLFKKANVSRTAYYALTRKESVLPKSIGRIAESLDVSPLHFLEDNFDAINRIRNLQARTSVISAKNPSCDRDVIFRTLANLNLPPIERLRKALIRGRKHHLHR